MSIDRRSLLASPAALLIPSVGQAGSGSVSRSEALLARLDQAGAVFSVMTSHPGWYEVRLPASAIGTPLRFSVSLDPAFNCDPGLARLIAQRLAPEIRS